MAIENTEGYPLISWRETIIKTKYMNTQRQTGTCRSLSGHAQRHGCEVRPSYEISTSQFSDMKVRRLTRNYGFGGYSIYRYLVSEALYKGSISFPGVRRPRVRLPLTGMPLWKTLPGSWTVAYRSACSMTNCTGSTEY